MGVFEYNKSLLNRLHEAEMVLKGSGVPIPASRVRNEWSCLVELQIEPAGCFFYYYFFLYYYYNLL